MQIHVNDYLTWERAVLPSNVSESVCPVPIPIKDSRPDWFKTIPGNLRTADLPKQTQQDIDMLTSHGWRSVKFCEGIKGIRQIGYTLPLPSSLDNWRHMDTSPLGWAEAYLHPEMLHGTHWAENDGNGNYKWSFKILCWPWRARMSKGWRLAMGAYPLNWSREWFCFSGAVDANYEVSDNGRNIGSFWQWEETIDSENYNYFNLETVVALTLEPGLFAEIIPAGEFIFSAVPVYDPDYAPVEFKGYPTFV